MNRVSSHGRFPRAALGLPASARRAFTFIELVAALGLLLIVVTLLARVIPGSEDSVRSGTERAETDMAARGVLGWIEFDIRHAYCDGHIPFLLQPDTQDSYGFTNSRLEMLSFQNPVPDGYRSASLVTYRVLPSEGTVSNRYRLTRSVRYIDPDLPTNDPDNAYWNDAWMDEEPDEEATLADNVTGFLVGVPSTNDNDLLPHYDSRDPEADNRLPPYVDVYLELLDASDAATIMEMIRLGIDESQWQLRLERRARRFATRVASPNNRMGEDTP